MKTFLKKLEYHFFVETTKIESFSTSFSFKTALSEANVKTNRMTTTKYGHITKRGDLPATILFFWKICSSLRTS